MRKTRKILSVVIMVMMLMGLMSVSFAQENLCDPFNNDLFTVEKEIEYDMGYDSYLPDDMETYSLIPNEDYSLSKIVKITYNENGEKVVTDITEFATFEQLNQKYNELFGKVEYNDGLKAVRNEEGFGYDYLDVNNNEVCFGSYGQGAFSGYNIGVFRDAYGGMNMDTGVYDNFTTTFTNVMTDNAQYSFEASFTNFSDKGYAIMQKDDKFYIVKLKKGVIPTVFYNGEKIKFDQIPVIENGRTLVPLRAIFEKIGASVLWDGDTQTVTATKDDITVSLTIDNTTATKNGESITLDVAAKIINGRTLVPVRFVSDCFGVDVGWDDVMQKVTLTK